MTDTLIPSTTSSAEPAPIVVAPVVAPVPVAPAVEPAPIAPAEVTPPVAAEKPPEAPVAEVAPPTVLGEAPKETPPEKPVEAPVEGKEPAETAEKKSEGGQSDETAPPPKYDPWTLPEGIKLDETKAQEFTTLLADLEKSGGDHSAIQQFGQKAVDLYVNEVKTAVEGIQKYYQDTWDKTKTTWREEFLKDPDLGGNRFQTTVDAANTFIRTHGGTADEQAEFRALMDSSGLGNHKVVIRILANAGKAMSEGRPLASVKPPAAPKSKTQTLYGGKS